MCSCVTSKRALLPWAFANANISIDLKVLTQYSNLINTTLSGQQESISTANLTVP